MTLRSTRRLLLTFLLLLTCAGCGSTTQADVVGEWRADYVDGHEVLTLQRDGLYDQRVFVAGSETARVTHRGVWRFEDLDSGWPHVRLEDCLVAADDETGRIDPSLRPSGGSCSYPVEREWLISNEFRIGSLEGTVYKKVK